MIETNSIVVSGKAFLSSIGELTEENMGRLYDTEEVIFDIVPQYDYLNLRCSRTKKVDKSNWKEFDSASSFRRLPNAYKFAIYVVEKALCNAKVNPDNDISVDELREERERLLQKLQQAKSEAIKEFAERLKSISIGLEIGDDKKFKMTVVSTVAIDCKRNDGGKRKCLY